MNIAPSRRSFRNQPWNRKTILIVAALAAVWLAGIWSAQFLELAAQHRFENDLAERIRTEVKRDSSVLNLKSVTDFEWDHVFVFGPYTPKSRIDETLGEKWRGSAAIESDDGINLVVFTLNHRIVRYAELGRYIDFNLQPNTSGWSPQSANFRVAVDGQRITILANDGADSPK